MLPQIDCLRRGIVALVAFVWLFSTVGFQMLPHIACMRRYVVALVAFVWLFSTVRFQMCPQRAWIRAGKVTLVAFVCLFSTLCCCPCRCCSLPLSLPSSQARVTSVNSLWYLTALKDEVGWSFKNLNTFNFFSLMLTARVGFDYWCYCRCLFWWSLEIDNLSALWLSLSFGLSWCIYKR